MQPLPVHGTAASGADSAGWVVPVTLKKVAARAGVSQLAVSRTFTEEASVSGRTRRKVEKAAAALFCSPSLIARSLLANNFVLNRGYTTESPA